ncbi:heme-binding protein, partial [Bradyrhizobium sp. NBAIM08]|uniref:heme-binding protein n=1 Tax=Bradyrhizobium sp. NBAIM08 TaxID=2793815 RepID=UPI001CD6E55D
ALANQNGVVFFPGSSPLYTSGKLVGGFGVSGDGVDQDDVVTAAGQVGFAAPDRLRVDQYVVGGVRLPFQKYNRNPQGA